MTDTMFSLTVCTL